MPIVTKCLTCCQVPCLVWTPGGEKDAILECKQMKKRLTLFYILHLLHVSFIVGHM